VQELLLLCGEAEVVQTPRRYPAEDSESRNFAPARVGATAAESRSAETECFGSAGTDADQEDSRDARQDNSAHAASVAAELDPVWPPVEPSLR
jgi:hypothetical protein